MAPTAVLLLLISGFIGSQGFDFKVPKDYVSSWVQKASEMVSGHSAASTTESHTSSLTMSWRIVCTADGLYRNPENCSTFIQCANGIPYLKECPAGLHFSVSSQRCEYPCDAYCDETLACQCKWSSCNNDVCRLPADKGPCDGHDAYYYFNYKRGTCQKFAYGGCGGNANRFRSRRLCEKKCLRTSDAATESPRQHVIPSNYVCTKNGLFKNPEDCNSYVQCSNGIMCVTPCPKGLHFSEELQSCEQPCTARCDKKLACDCGWDTCDDKMICELPPVRGPCHMHHMRYFYDVIDRRCRSFTYGGCRGNRNNFRSIWQCKATCMKGYDFENTQTTLSPEDLESGPWAPQINKGYPEYSEMSTEESLPRKIFSNENDHGYRCMRDGNFSIPGECVSYLECRYGVGLSRYCPDNTHFNSKTERCEEQCKAHCDPQLAASCSWNTDDTTEVSSYTAIYDEMCTEDGLYRNAEDCRSYLNCSQGRWKITYCPPGEHFSVAMLNCTKPCNAYCEPSLACQCDWQICKSEPAVTLDVMSSSSKIYSNPHDCTSYIKVTGSHEEIIKCPEGKHFSKVLSACEDPCIAMCDPALACECYWPICGRSSRIDEKLWKEIPSDYSRQWDVKYPPTTTECSEDELFSETSYKCIKDGVFPNPRNCTSFIQCIGGSALVRPCPPTLHFNAETEQCDTVCNAHCDQSYACQCNWTDDCAKRFPNLFTSSDSPEFTCREDGFQKMPRNCSAFIHCAFGKRHVQACPKGLHFSEKTKVCEWPCEAHCDKSLACVCGWPECDRRVDCDAEPDIGMCYGLLDRYYYDKENGECRKFTHGLCDRSSNNFGTEEECLRECKEKLVGDFQCPTPNGRYGDYFDCTMYFQCERYSATLKRCPKGMAFDHLLAKCVTEYEAKCVFECPSKDAVYPYPLDTHKYIDCVNGISKVEKCPSGEIFDAEERNCVSDYSVWDE